MKAAKMAHIMNKILASRVVYQAGGFEVGCPAPSGPVSGCWPGSLSGSRTSVPSETSGTNISCCILFNRHAGGHKRRANKHNWAATQGGLADEVPVKRQTDESYLISAGCCPMRTERCARTQGKPPEGASGKARRR